MLSPERPSFASRSLTIAIAFALALAPAQRSWAQAQSASTSGASQAGLPTPTAPASLALQDGRSVSMTGTGLIVASADGKVATVPGVAGRIGASLVQAADGRIWVIGGMGQTGNWLTTIERYDWSTGAADTVPAPMAARAGQSAVTLTDGRVLIIGGVDPAGQAAIAGVIDTSGKLWTEIPSQALERIGQTAELLANGSVLVAGGKVVVGGTQLPAGPVVVRTEDLASVPATDVEVKALKAADALPIQVAASLPADAATVSPGSPLSVRFSAPALPASVTDKTVVLMGATGAVPARVFPAEGGRLAFLLPARPLLPGSAYSLFVQGVRDAKGSQSVYYAAAFRTAALGQVASTNSATTKAAAVLPAAADSAQQATASEEQNEYFEPDGRHFGGRWVTFRPLPEQVRDRFKYDHQRKVARDQLVRTAGSLQVKAVAAAGSGSVEGLVLKLNDQPLSNAAIRIAGKSVRTDANGRFVVDGIPAGKQSLEVDGTDAVPGKQFAQFIIGVDVQPGQVNNLPHAIHVARIHARDWINITSPAATDLVLTHPKVPGFEIRVPKGTVLKDKTGNALTRIAMVPVPLDRAPAPVEFNSPTYVSLQPAGITVQGISPETSTGIQVIYPNLTREMPGTVAYFHDYSASDDGWYIYGYGKVSADGARIEPDAGRGFFRTIGFMVSFPGPGGDGGGDGPGGDGPGGGGPGGGGGGNGGSGDGGNDGGSSGGGDGGNDGGSGSGGGNGSGGNGGGGNGGSGGGGNGGDGGNGGNGGGGNGGDGGNGGGADTKRDGSGDNNNKDTPADTSCSATSGDPVFCPTGAFTLERADFTVRDIVPIKLYRSYNSMDPVLRGSAVGTNSNFHMYLRGDLPNLSYLSLVLQDGTELSFNRTTPGTGWAGAVFQHSSTKTEFYKATLTYTTFPSVWEMRLVNGTVYEFTGSGGWVTAIRDRWGNRVTITRSGGTVSRVTSPSGRYIDFIYNTAPNTNIVRDHGGRELKYVDTPFNGTKRVLTVTDSLGSTETIEFDKYNRITKITDARGGVLTNQYVSSPVAGSACDTSYTMACAAIHGKVVRQVAPDGGVWAWVYAPQTGGAMQVDITDPRGMVRRKTFNASRAIISTIDAFGTALARTHTFNRNSDNLLSAYVDPLGRRTEYTYDTNGNTTKVTALAGTANAVSSQWTYDSRWNLPLTATNALGQTSRFTYDFFGNQIQRKDPLGKTWSSTYNSAGQILTSTDPLGNVTTYTYDVFDLRTVKDPLNRVTTFQSDLYGRKIAVVDALGNRSDFQYDIAGRIVKSTNPMGQAVSMTYDAHDNLTKFVDAKGNTTTFTYDAMDRRKTRTDALLRVETTVYDVNSNPTSFTDRKGQVSTTVYDLLNRPTQTTWADGSKTTWTYDNGDRMLTASEFDAGATVARHVVTRQYDGLDRMTRETVPLGQVDYGYTATSLRQSMTVSGQPAVTYGWDAASRLTTITQGTGATAKTVGFTYDASNRTSTATLANGVVATYGYDAASQLTAITYAKAGTTIGNITYGYDALGRRTTIGGTLYESFLATATTANGVYDANNKLTSWNGVAYTYDNNGSLIADGAKTYVWDARNRLKQIKQGTSVVAAFEYDAMGRRTKKTVGTAVTQYVYDGANAVQELTSTNSVAANILGGIGMDQWFLRAEGATTRHFLTDALGSTRALTDDTSAIKTRYQYEAFGETRTTGDMSSNVSQYTGRENDGSMIYYYRARYYAPGLKRFISEDPIGLRGGVNYYSYVNNQPLDSVDPDGLEPKSPIYRCVNCGGPHGGLFYPLCPDCFKKLDPAPNSPSTPKKCP